MKAYQLAIEEKAGYLHFRVSGENTLQSVLGYLAEVYEACMQKNCSSVLIEENLRGPSLSTMDIFQVASQGSEQTHPHVRRIAYVDSNPEHSRHDMQFAENVAVNRGVNMRVFSTVPDAERWLVQPVAGTR